MFIYYTLQYILLCFSSLSSFVPSQSFFTVLFGYYSIDIFMNANNQEGMLSYRAERHCI
jgi:hypothetical protein